MHQTNTGFFAHCTLQLCTGRIYGGLGPQMCMRCASLLFIFLFRWIGSEREVQKQNTKHTEPVSRGKGPLPINQRFQTPVARDAPNRERSSSNCTTQPQNTNRHRRKCKIPNRASPYFELNLFCSMILLFIFQFAKISTEMNDTQNNWPLSLNYFRLLIHKFRFD